MPDRKRTYYGVSIGILMLDTHFERFNGDIGNARTWPFPVQYRIVRDATPNRVTHPEGPDMLDAFKAAANDLIAAGVDGITTTCGFLALYQKELAAHCAVPVAATRSCRCRWWRASCHRENARRSSRSPRSP